MGYNIALLHYTCPPVVGGVEEIIRQQAALFNRNYHDVKVFAGQGGIFTECCEVEINPILGSQSEEVRNANRLCQNGEKGLMEDLARKIHNYLVAALAGFDILIAHNVLTMPYNLALTGAVNRIAGEGMLPVISWNHDSPYFYLNYPRYLDCFPWNMLRTSHNKINYVIISSSRKELFRKLYKSNERLYVIPDGIDPISFFGLDQATVRLIRERRLFEAEFIMVQPSRLHPRKNIELSIRVTSAMRDMGVKALLLITGAYDPHENRSLDYYLRLKALAGELGAEEHVIILAEYFFDNGEKLSVDQITIRDLYLIGDILFLPSFQEGFGIPLLESGMVKMPVVCSNISPFREIVGRDGCFFNVDEAPQEIALRIMDFVGGIKPYHMFRKVMNKYVWDNIYHQKLGPLIGNIIGRGQKAASAP